ncbi:MAG: hypothetical protein AAB632_00160 [Patescibacteria group bacterium]
MISEARIASRSTIAIDLKSRGIEGEGSYNISVLKDMEQLLGDLLILRDSGDTYPTPETQIIDTRSARLIQSYFNQCEQYIKEKLDRFEWAADQVRKVQEGNFPADELCSYLTILSGLLLSIEDKRWDNSRSYAIASA